MDLITPSLWSLVVDFLLWTGLPTRPLRRPQVSRRNTHPNTGGTHVHRILIALTFLLTPLAVAQDLPAFTNLRFDEDWSAFDPGPDDGFLKKIKHIDLSDRVWLSIGGEDRLRLEYFNDFGFAEGNDDEYLLYRTFLHADLHLGDHFRVFVQGRFSGASDRDLPGGKRFALDVDEGDLWNTFVEGNFGGERAKVTLRLGRQEMAYGKQRLISPLDWSNNRRIFDGGVLSIDDAEGRWSVDAFATSPVIIDGNDFHWNDTDDDRLFSGVYYTQKLGQRGHGLDAYFLALNHIDDAPIEEDRYTLGGRVYGPIAGNFSFEIEGAYQFGERTVRGTYFDDDLDIAAWMLTGELTYTFAESKMKPWITVGADYASGDADPADGDVGTFSHLFPLGHAYLGHIDAVGRQNIIDARLSGGLWPVPGKLKIGVDLHAFWRAEEEDGLYNAGGDLSRTATYITPGERTLTTGDREVGQELDLTVLYKINRHLSMLSGYGHFFAGDFLEATGTSEDVDFVYSQIEFTF